MRVARKERSEPVTGLAPHAGLERVFREHYSRVVGVATRVLADRHAAEDVAQEVFLSYSRSGVTPAEAAGWLSVAAAHTALNHVRGERRRDAREQAYGDSAGRHQPDAADEAVRNEQRQLVREALARLPHQQAVALVLRHSGLSYSEVATALSIAPSGVGTTLRRAEAALRKELGPDASPE